MLWNSSAIKGYAIKAADGRIGTVSDLLFDDSTWLVRWLVVETGTWLSNRKVLLPTSVLGHPNLEEHEFSVRLSKKQVEDSPDIDTDRPVSRQMETDTYDYYGWSPYWGTGFYMGGYGQSALLTAPELGAMRRHAEQDIVASERRSDDAHLRSVAAVTGYHIHAKDGEIGHVEDFLVEDADWSIHYLVADTKNWLPGKRVLISPRSVRDIVWSDRLVNLGVTRHTIQDSPPYETSTVVDRTYEKKFHSHYAETGPSGRL